MPQQVEAYLRTLKVPDTVKADAWDAVYSAKDDADAEQRLRRLPVPNEVRAQLWDMRGQAAPVVDLPAPMPSHATTQQRSPDAADFTAGIGRGILRSTVDLGSLWHQIPGVSRAVDAVYGSPGLSQAAFPAARRGLESVDIGRYGPAGEMVEKAAEYVVPAGRVARAARAAPWFGRTMAQAGTAAGVAGVQTELDPGAMITAAGVGAIGDTAFRIGGATVNATRRAAAGATEGGIGGAIAAGVRTTAPLNAKAMLFQAIKPRATLVHWDRSMNVAVPELKAAEQMIGRPIANVDDLLDATVAAKKHVYEQLTQVRGTAQGFEVDLSPVADAMVRSIPRKLRLENPTAAEQLQGVAQVYRRRFSLDDAEQLLKETNAEMEAFYSKFPAAQRKALVADPEWARLDAQAKALRTSIDATLDRAAEGGGTAAHELRRRYGALLDVESESFRRANVAKRQQPESLSEQLSAARAAGEIARGTWRVMRGDFSGAADIAAGIAMRDTSKFLKEQQTTNKLIERAFAAVRETPASIQMPTRRPIAGALPPAARPMPAAPDPSFARGVPAQPAFSGTPRQLPAPARPMPSHGGGSVGAIEARSIVVRDPRTGRMRRIYVSDGAE